MSTAIRRHYDAIHQLARDEWPPDEPCVERAPDELADQLREAAR